MCKQWVSVCVCACECALECVYLSICEWVHECVFVCWVCIYVSIWVCEHVHVCVKVCVSIILSIVTGVFLPIMWRNWYSREWNGQGFIAFVNVKLISKGKHSNTRALESGKTRVEKCTIKRLQDRIAIRTHSLRIYLYVVFPIKYPVTKITALRASGKNVSSSHPKAVMPLAVC